MFARDFNTNVVLLGVFLNTWLFMVYLKPVNDLIQYIGIQNGNSNTVRAFNVSVNKVITL